MFCRNTAVYLGGFLCFLSPVIFKNLFPQMLQMCDISPMWIFMCSIRILLWWKLFPQVLQRCRFTHVENQMITATKTFPACFARVRLLTWVEPCVIFKWRRCTKLFTTCLTLIRFLTCVSSHVDGQMIVSTKVFPTWFTGIWLLTCVDLCMLSKYWLARKHFTTSLNKNKLFVKVFVNH